MLAIATHIATLFAGIGLAAYEVKP